MKEISSHAEQAFPSESCGVIVIVKGRKKYIPCRNIANQGDFAIHPEDYAGAEDLGKIVMIVHSHPNVSPKPSAADLIGCERSGMPWLIINWPTAKTYEFKPTGYKTPLIGRVFQHGILDCYTFIQDYYDQNLNITLPDFYRPDNWWLSGANLYLDNFESAGFTQVDDLQEHDVILMTVASKVPNHGAIYAGDGKIEHHLVNRLSSRDILGGWYSKISTHYLRHKEFLLKL
jgi:proteasome lid subunit RPN8/RPN11